jgi:hypothetical protein
MALRSFFGSHPQACPRQLWATSGACGMLFFGTSGRYMVVALASLGRALHDTVENFGGQFIPNAEPAFAGARS